MQCLVAVLQHMRLTAGDLQDCEAALELDAGAVKAARRRAQALRDLGQHHAAVQACASFLANFPEHEQDIDDLRTLLQQDIKRQRKVLRFAICPSDM